MPLNSGPSAQCLGYLESVSQLAPAVVAARDLIERDRTIPSDLLDAMHDAGLLTLWLAHPFGGPELHAADFIRVIEAISALDGSVGWCTCIAAAHSRFSGYLPAGTVHRIFSARRPVLAGSLPPTGRARRVDGGWRVSGRWSYGSGIRHSTWILAACVESDETAVHRPMDAPRLRIVFFQAEQANVIDTWEVGGLRGTGSHDFTVNDLFVTEEQTIAGPAAPAIQPGPLYGMPLVSIFGLAIAAVPLGIARGAVDTFGKLAREKPLTLATGLLRDRSVVQDSIGRAEALLRSARAFLFEVTAILWDVAAAGSEPTLHQRALVRLACSQVGIAAKEVVRTVYELAGGSAIYTAAGLERSLRDVQTAGQHIGLQTAYFEHAGRVMLGLDPGTSRF